MRAAPPFSWLDSPGWIILSGRPDALSEIRARALSRFNGSGAIAYISLAGDLGDALMDDLAELGAPAGYLVDLDDLDNNEIYERLCAAGMIVIEATGDVDGLRTLTTHTVASALKSALEHGAVLFLEGGAVSLAGEHRMAHNGELERGLNFVDNALIAAGADRVAALEPARSALSDLPDLTFMELGPGSALALGPDQQIETWGDGEVTIRLAKSVGAIL
ncbi:MAG: hypothetical protein OXG85_11290 [Chloroflexi bacterium]|nr:hypothetical protein [Chloroflexota bacterium]